jgi:hypothetical protein
VNHIWKEEFCEEGWHDIGEEDDTFRDGRANEVEGARQDDDVENVIDETY